jgi:hypothetical protein
VKTCAILGCGPAGLIAAEAATQAGLTPLIFSRKVKSPMPGAQFLHAPIPGISQEGDEHKIKFIKTGTREGYARKVYGAPDAPCSWDEYPQGERVGWDLPAAYDRLWGKYQERILNGSLTAPVLDFIEGSFDIVFSSIPLSYLCENPNHQFFNAKVWIRSWRVAGGVNFVEYNGELLTGHYRASVLGEWSSMEYGQPPSRSMIPALEGMKPLRSTCDCRPSIRRIGRFGKWEKGVLLHHVWDQVEEELSLAL